MEGISDWLRAHGLSFNPFSPLQADQDKRLWMYWVGNPGIFELAWKPAPAILFAPPGGGKSALRTRLTQECWAAPPEYRPFPLVYLPQVFATEVSVHVQGIIAHGARELLLALARYPRRFLETAPRHQKAFAAFIRSALPEVGFLLDQMVEEESLSPLNRPYDPGYDLEIPREERGDWLAFILALRHWLTQQEDLSGRSSPTWQELLDWIEDFLHRPAVYILVDGLDAWPETAYGTDHLVASILPLLQQAPMWAEKRCYLKLFLPANIHSLLPPQTWKTGVITWTEPLLLEILRRRMLAASRGRLDALSALAEPALADLDERLVQSVPPLPRELLVAVNLVLYEHARASKPRIESPTFTASLHRYQEDLLHGVVHPARI